MSYEYAEPDERNVKVWRDQNGGDHTSRDAAIRANIVGDLARAMMSACSPYELTKADVEEFRTWLVTHDGLIRGVLDND